MWKALLVQGFLTGSLRFIRLPEYSKAAFELDSHVVDIGSIVGYQSNPCKAASILPVHQGLFIISELYGYHKYKG